MNPASELLDEPEYNPRHARSWLKKFTDASRGIKIAVRAEVNFFVHIFTTAIVLITGWLLGISRLQWCVLALSIALVIAAEMMNTALERLAHTLVHEKNLGIRDTLDMASGAVLVTSVGAVVVGMIVLAEPLWNLLW